MAFALSGPNPLRPETAIMDQAILKYMHLAGDVWIYLNNHAIRKATGAEIARIIDHDPEFALHFAMQNTLEPPMFRARVIPLQGLEQPN
jgi:hypothetical protein